MPFGHEVDLQERLVVVRGSGAGSIAETEDSLVRLLADSSLTSDFRVLILVDAIALTPSPEETAQIGRFIGLLRTRFEARIAIVTTTVGKATPAALIALYGSSTGGADVRSFDDEQTARMWLKGRSAT